MEALQEYPLVEGLLSVNQQPAVTTVRVQTRQPLSSIAPIASSDALADAEIRSINLVRPTLEDVFVSLTGSVITEVGDAERV